MTTTEARAASAGAGGFGRGGFGRGFGARLSEQVQYTPFGDAIVLDFALELLRAEELGSRNALDILTIGLSANDFVGHAFGPDSVEAKRMACGLDRNMARLLRTLDETVGAEHYLLVLASDHGVAYPPEAVSSAGLAAKRYSSTEMARRIRRHVSIKYRYLEWDGGFSASGFYFEPEARLGGGVDAQDLEKAAAEVIRDTAGIAAAYTRSDILGGKLPDTDLARRVLAAYNADRSPDVFLVPEPYWISGTTAASHGTPYAYDAHVPLVFYGAGLKPARILRTVSMTSMAPTLTAIFGCSPPSASQGGPLAEVVQGVTGEGVSEVAERARGWRRGTGKRGAAARRSARRPARRSFAGRIRAAAGGSFERIRPTLGKRRPWLRAELEMYRRMKSASAMSSPPLESASAAA
jgi:hypothetical protein